MRIILYTGKGGVGKTSIAASSAIKSAEKGLKTLIMSTDPAHSLGDSLNVELNNEPKVIMENLEALEINVAIEMERNWGKVKEYLIRLFSATGANKITTEEISIFPGLEDVLSLYRVVDAYKNGDYDVIYLDCAPTGETLGLLSYPDMLKWWMDKFWNFGKKTIKYGRPIMEPVFKIPLPKQDVLNEIEKVYDKLVETREIFTNPDVTSVRLVMNPEKMVIKEAQRSFTYLNLYGFNVDAIVINKIFSKEVTDIYFKAWVDMQQKYIKLINESFNPVPVYYSAFQQNEVVGIEALEEMAKGVFNDEEPSTVKHVGKTQTIVEDKNGFIFSVATPFAEKSDLKINIKGDELTIATSNFKRHIIIPKSLIGLEIKKAKFEDGKVNLHFS